MFLGVKAVEYSHKWHLGLYVAYFFHYDPGHHEGGTNYLLLLSIVPAICVVGALAMSVLGFTTKKTMSGQFWGLMTLGLLGYFGGVGAATFYQDNFAPADPGTVALVEGEHGDTGHAEGDVHAGAETTPAEGLEAATLAELATEGANAEVEAINATRNLGLFFSIYYFMTGLHAFHIIAGIMALGWLLYRTVHRHFRADYYGPVDYVGLYWHLVDLIWIYLFPLLYLIGSAIAMAHHEDATQTAEGHPLPSFSHPMPLPTLLATFFALVFFTIVTVVVAKMLPLGSFEVWVSIGIATVKAALVLLFFMHMLHDKPFNVLVFFSSFLFAALFIGLTLTDTDQYQDSIRDAQQQGESGAPFSPALERWNAVEVDE